MALSNIRKEPRREIMESVVGTLAFILFLFACNPLAYALQATGMFGAVDMHHGLAYTVSAFILLAAFWIAVGLGIFLVHGLHNIGDFLCDMLGEIGLDPRPRGRARKEIKYERNKYGQIVNSLEVNIPESWRKKSNT